MRSVPILTATLLLATATAAFAQEPTRVTVRVTANDAKIIGSGVGGARVIVLDAATRDTLAHGIQEGGTGSTGAIMNTPRERGVSIFDTEGAASFVAEFDILEPTQVEVIAEGPLGTPHAMQRASKTVLVLPGRHITGDGLELRLHGYTIVLDEEAYSVEAGATFEFTANVTMLCGCPTEPGGTWDSDRWEMVAHLIRDGEPVASTELGYAGTTSNFSGSFAALDAGDYELRVIVADPERTNTGMAIVNVTVR